MENKLLENELTEDQLEALYIYLSLNYNDMENDEKLFWFELMKSIDKEFSNEN